MANLTRISRKWSEEIEHQVAQVDAKVTYFNKHLATQEDFEAKETEKALKAKEREDQLKFERAQFEQKLEFELKLIQEELRNEIKRSQSKRGAGHKTAAQTDYHLVQWFSYGLAPFLEHFRSWNRQM